MAQPAAGTVSGVASETVRFESDGTPIPAFLARPADVPGRRGQAVVILQEWWGLNDHIKDVARRFAAEGYTAFAPDLYARQGSKVTADPNEAAALMNALSSQVVLRDLNAAVRYLAAQAAVEPQRIGVVGFCMGGTFALMLATHNSDIRAAVPFYGKVPPLETLEALLCPVLYHYGANDQWVTRQEVDRLREGLARYGKPGEAHIYPEAGHAFFNDTRPQAYRAEDARLAWERTLAFFRNYLR